MTRKHYVMLAAAIKEAQAHNPWPGDSERRAADLMRRTVANNVASVLGHDNPAFDRARFLKAAGVQ
jgi:hypothetical protein